MDIEKFRALLNDPTKSKPDLLAMRENALRKNAGGHVHAAEAALEVRFPGWQDVNSRRGGGQATHVTFRGRDGHFDSQKEAYVWLIERFVQFYPRPFIDLDWQTVFVAAGPRALYFAKSPAMLFGKKQHLADDPNKYQRLTNGWYTKLVLSEKQKIELLTKFGAVAGLKLGADWDWNSLGKNSPQLDVDELLRRFEQ